ncbi:MAG TPA: phosphate ABC transporter, permease protein PstA, partial [Streptomyces sp.]
MSNAVVTDKRPSTLRGARLPKWGPWAIALGSVVLAVGIGLVAGLDSKVQWGLIAAILFLLGTFGIATRVEGRRQAKDRIATALVWVAFLIAVVPLVSLVWVTISRGVKVLNIY